MLNMGALLAIGSIRAARATMVGYTGDGSAATFLASEGTAFIAGVEVTVHFRFQNTL